MPPGLLSSCGFVVYFFIAPGICSITGCSPFYTNFAQYIYVELFTNFCSDITTIINEFDILHTYEPILGTP